MCTNKYSAVIIFLAMALLPIIGSAQEIKGDTIYASTTQQTVLYFPSGILATAWNEKKGYENFDTIVDNSLVSLRAKIRNASPAVLNITEGNRRHSFIIAYKDELTDNELHHNWSNLNDLKQYAANFNRRNGVVDVKSRKQSAATKSKNPEVFSAAHSRESVDDEYNDLLFKSYDFVEKKNFAEAKRLFDKANLIKDKKFNEQLTKANKFFAAKNYEEAKITYLLALSLKPEDAFAQKRLKESQKMLQSAPAKTDIASKEKGAVVRPADTVAAAAIKPKQIEIVKKPVEKVKRDTVLTTAVWQSENIMQDEISDKYDKAVAKATELSTKKAYNEALTSYQEAAVLKPKEDLPPKMIKFVKNVMTHVPEEQKRDQDLRRKARIIEIKNQGNEAILNKDWKTAKALYTEMLTLQPLKGDEEFARKKIETIDLQLERIARQVPVKKEPQAVAAAPKNRREARAQRILAERNAILASAASKPGAGKPGETNSVSGSDLANQAGKISFWTLNQFKTDFSNADSVQWSIYPNFTKVNFVQDEDRVEAFYDVNNTLIGTSRSIRPSRLPATAKRNFIKSYPNFIITEVISFEGSEGYAYYISAEKGGEKVILKVDADNNYKMQAVKDFLVNGENKDRNINAADNKNKTIKELMDRALKETNNKNWENAKKLYGEVIGMEPPTDIADLAKKKVQIIDLQMQIAGLDNEKPQKKYSKEVASSKKLPKKNLEAPVALQTAAGDGKLKGETSLKKLQSAAIPYTREELVKKYPAYNFNEMPEGQVYDTSDRKNRLVQYETSKKVLGEAGQLNVADSNNVVKLVCEDIVFRGKDVYLKLLIQNKSATADFLTGALQIALLKSNGALQKLYPRFVSDFPVVMPQKEFAVVYVSDAFVDVNPNDIFYLEMSDRLKKNKVTVLIPGNIYLRQKPL